MNPARLRLASLERSALTLLLLPALVACGDIVGEDGDPGDDVFADAGGLPDAGDDPGDDLPDAGDALPDAGDDEVPLAPFDNDSLQAPAQDVFLSITGTRSFSHVEEVSHPDGDLEDWVQFEFPNNANTAQRVDLRLTCTFIGDAAPIVRATLYEDGESLIQSTACNDGLETFTVDNSKVQSVQITTINASEALHVAYTLDVIGFD